MELYQFPISHYCEKARWALQIKQLEFHEINSPPGLHKLILKIRAPQARPPLTVPLLTDGNSLIQGSSAIVDFAQRNPQGPPLGFDDPDLMRECQQKEQFLTDEVAPVLRSIAYGFFLPRKKFLLQTWGMGLPTAARAWLLIAYPVLKRLISRMYDTENLHVHHTRFNSALERLDSECERSHFLIGNRFSRADLAMAALLAPLDFPAEHPYPWPGPYPEDYRTFCLQHAERPCIRRVHSLYRNFRTRGINR